MYRGGCLCGAVRFEAGGAPGRPIACHCRQCRRQSGHVFAAMPVAKDSLRFARQEGLAWYRQTDIAVRGFCRICGASLFWRADEGPNVMVALGALDDTADMRLSSHWWTAFRGDYHEIADGLPQYRGGEP